MGIIFARDDTPVHLDKSEYENEIQILETEIRRLRRDIKQIEIELSKNHRDIGVKDSKIEELNSVINDQRTTIQALKKQII